MEILGPWNSMIWLFTLIREQKAKFKQYLNLT